MGHTVIDGGEPTGRRIAKQRVLPIRFLLGLVVVGLVVIWFYAFFLAPSGNPDRMKDRAWPSAAELRCAVARDTITALPTARHSKSPVERAAVIDEATGVLSELVSDLGSLAGGSDDDLDLVKRWLDDSANVSKLIRWFYWSCALMILIDLTGVLSTICTVGW